MSNSTYSRGDLFEIKTYELLKTLLSNDDFFVSGKRSKIFRKKGYYSEDRKSKIIFDIAIETYLNNSHAYSLLTLIECKNYKSPVPVNDLEEFDSKISQISEHNTKGILISNNSFQSGAHDFARSKGIGLARVNNNDEFEWIVNRKATTSTQLHIAEAIAFLETEEIQEGLNFLAVNDDFVLPTIAELLIQVQVIDFFIHKEKFINIPFVTKDRIDQIVTKMIAYDIYSEKMMDENKICRFLESKYSVTFEFENNLKDEILGKIEFDPLKISVTKNLRKDLPRWRFTLAHEIGHLILHSKLFKDKISEKTDTDFSLSFKYSVSEMTSRRLEYQANLFAGHLLLPINTLQQVVQKYFSEQRIHKGYLYWDNQPVNQQLVYGLLTEIGLLFGVSIEVGRIRLITLGLLIDDRYKRLRDILKEMQLI